MYPQTIFVRDLLARRKVSKMTLSTAYHASKQRCFSSIVIAVVSILMPIATFVGINPVTVYGASSQVKGASSVPLIDGTPGLSPTSTQVNTLPSFTNTSQQTISGITLAVFYKRPDGFMPSGQACTNPVLSFTPSNSVKNPNQSCPWFTCNYVSWSPQGQGECSSVGVSDQQLKQATNAASLPKTTAWSQFEPVSSSSDTGADAYMLLKFPDASLTPGDKFELNGCIYYDNWPRFSDQKAIDALAVYSGDNTLLRVWGTLPQGMDAQTLAKNSLKGNTAGGTGASTGWMPPSNA
jgi:hypothetical protein